MTAKILIFSILLFTLLTEPVQASWAHSVFRASSCVLCAGCIVFSAWRGRLRGGWTVWTLMLPVVWGLVQLALGSTVWRFATWNASLQWFASLCLFVCALQLTSLRSHLRDFAWFGGAFSIFAVVRLLASHGSAEPMMGTFFNHNHYAALIELLFPVAIWRLLRDRFHPLNAISALAMLSSVALSGSRAGIVLVLLELLYLGLRTSRKPFQIAGGTLALAAIAVAIMWPRFEKIAGGEPFESRNATALASLRMLKDRPVMGFGLGTWANVYPAYAVRDTGFRLIHADNDWLEWAAEGGVPFLAIMLSIALAAIWAAWREPWSVGCVAVLLHSLTEFPMQKQVLWAFFAVLLAIAQTRGNLEIARRKQAS